MVEMSCEGCVKAVRNKLETVDGGCLTTFFFIELVYFYSGVFLHCSCLILVLRD